MASVNQAYLQARYVPGEGRARTNLAWEYCAMEKLDSYLSDTKKCVEAVHKMSTRQFNNGQCEYLIEKLTSLVESDARSFLEAIKISLSIPSSSTCNYARMVESFKFLLALAKQIVTFVQGCCKDEWIQAAMTLTNVSHYVSSLGFKLELCKAAFSGSRWLTMGEVGNINKVQVEIVERVASVDVDSLLRKVTRELNSLRGENRDLAAYLLQRLLMDKPNSSSDDEGFLNRLFEWLIPGDQLGRGTSATVHRATWLGTPVAKKTFDGTENPHFSKEVKILSQLCHPNITSMFCWAKNTRKCSIIMELMDGDLHTLMERRLEENSSSESGSGSECPPFPIMEAVDMMIQLGEGVNYLHRRGIVHRDLKSQNILVKAVEPPGSELEVGYVHVKLADFGISKANVNSTTYSNQTCNTGTARWMAPEVINLVGGSQGSVYGDNMNPKYPFKCDTYSFAVVCYEILSGCVPFPNCHNANDLKKMVLKGERPELPKGCPRRLKVLIEKCWDQDPRKRPGFDDICLELKYVKYLLLQDFYIPPIGGSGLNGERTRDFLPHTVAPIRVIPRDQFRMGDSDINSVPTFSTDLHLQTAIVQPLDHHPAVSARHDVYSEDRWLIGASGSVTGCRGWWEDEIPEQSTNLLDSLEFWGKGSPHMATASFSDQSRKTNMHGDQWSARPLQSVSQQGDLERKRPQSDISFGGRSASEGTDSSGIPAPSSQASEASTKKARINCGSELGLGLGFGPSLKLRHDRLLNENVPSALDVWLEKQAPEVLYPASMDRPPLLRTVQTLNFGITPDT